MLWMLKANLIHILKRSLGVPFFAPSLPGYAVVFAFVSRGRSKRQRDERKRDSGTSEQLAKHLQVKECDDGRVHCIEDVKCKWKTLLITEKRNLFLPEIWRA